MAGYIDLRIDEIKNILTDTVLDDGTPVAISPGRKLAIQNVGVSDVSLNERETSRGLPTLSSPEADIIPSLGWVQVNVTPGYNYYVWSLNAPSRITVGDKEI